MCYTFHMTATGSPAPINQGNNGFHLYTVVTDGYGNLIAEDMGGTEFARAALPTDATEAQQMSVWLAFTQEVFYKLDGRESAPYGN